MGASVRTLRNAHGRRAFDGEDVTLTLSKVLQSEPALDALPPSVPVTCVRRSGYAYRKPLKERMPDIAAVRLALAGAFQTESPQHRTATSPSRATRGRRAAAVALTIALTGAGSLVDSRSGG